MSNDWLETDQVTIPPSKNGPPAITIVRFTQADYVCFTATQWNGTEYRTIVIDADQTQAFRRFLAGFKP
jgi:hypothetical protein